MTWFVVDVKTDGPAPGLFSMVSVGIVKLDRMLDQTFHGKFAPLAGAAFEEEALAVNGTTRGEHVVYPHPRVWTERLAEWVAAQTVEGSKPVFVSDNPAFDFAFVSYYGHLLLGKNVFGHSGRRIGDIYSGLVKDASKSSEWKQFRKTKPTHGPVVDARGNAEAILHMVDHLGLRGVPGVECAAAKNRLVTVGYIGNYRAYLNVTREEAIRRYVEREGPIVRGEQVHDFDFVDEFWTYAATGSDS